MFHNKRGHDSERPAHRNEEWPPLAAPRESPCTETKTQHSHKLKKTPKQKNYTTKLQSSKQHGTVVKKRHIDQWNSIESRNGPTLLYGQLIYGKAGKNIQWGKDSLFNKWCWENWTATRGRIKPDYSPTLCSKINSKWIKDLNVRCETIKLPEVNTGSKVFDTGLGNIFLDLSPQARETKAKINKWD